MAKAQTAKPKGGLAQWLRGLTAPQAANAPAPGARTGATGKFAAASTQPIPVPGAAQAGHSGLAAFRLPFIGRKPITVQMQALGPIALALLFFTGVTAYLDVKARSENAAYITITSQMQFHTQRLAKAAAQAARGLQSAFPQVQDSRDEFANYLNVLRAGGFAFGVTVRSAASNDETKSRIEELNQRWPDSAKAATAILAAQKDLVTLAQNISQIRVGAEEMATLSQELTSQMAQTGSAPAQVLRANRMTFLAERLGRGAAEIDCACAVFCVTWMAAWFTPATSLRSSSIV